MNYEEEIKRLNRLNMKMYMTMNEIINILNERETIILMKNLQNIKKEINFNDDNNNYIKLKNDVDYLMTKQKEREAMVSKYFTYDSTDSE